MKRATKSPPGTPLPLGNVGVSAARLAFDFAVQPVARRVDDAVQNRERVAIVRQRLDEVEPYLSIIRAGDRKCVAGRWRGGAERHSR